MSNFSATLIPYRRTLFGADPITATSGHFVTDTEMAMAAPSEVNTPDYYRSINRILTETNMCKLWIGALKTEGEYFHNAMQYSIDRKRYPANSLERSHFRVKKQSEFGGSRFYFQSVYNECQFKDTRTYLQSLNYTWGIEQFLQMILLHEAAGIYIGRIPNRQMVDYDNFSTNPQADLTNQWKSLGSVIFDMNSLPNGNPILLADGLHVRVFSWDFRGADDWQYSGNRSKDIGILDPAGNQIGFSGCGGIDTDTINAIKLQVYKGAMPSSIASFLTMLSRFRERVLAELLGQAFYMLDVAKLTDLDTVRTMYQKFTQDPMSIYGKIGMRQTIDIHDSDGVTRTETFSWDQFSNVKLRFAGNSGKVYDVSIPDYLKIQVESVIWLIMANLNKLEARIDQLETPTAQLVATAPVPFILDPYENPFLIYDKAMSDRLKEVRFVNVAASQAQQPVELAQGVTSVAIPKIHFDNAPTVRQNLLRMTDLTGGVTVNLRELTGTSKPSNAPWLLVALAAGAAFLTMKG